MPFCPDCGIEYRDGFLVCADCGSGLVMERPEPPPPPCSTCGHPLEKDTAWCPSCGHIIGMKPSERPACEEHPDRPSDSRCVVCGRPLCSECGYSVGPRRFCREEEDIETYGGGAVVFESPDRIEAHLVVARLDTEGIGAIIMEDPLDQAYPMPGADFGARNRVLVPFHMIRRAIEVLK